MFIVILLVPDCLWMLVTHSAVLKATLRFFAKDNLVVQASEILPWLLVVVRREPIRKVGTAGIPIWQSDGRSWGDMVLAALLAVLEEWGDCSRVRRRNQEVRSITTGTLEAGLSIIVDHFDE